MRTSESEREAAAIEAAARDGWSAVIEYSDATGTPAPVGYLHNWLLARAVELRNQ